MTDLAFWLLVAVLAAMIAFIFIEFDPAPITLRTGLPPTR